jgi:hypothetical protein
MNQLLRLSACAGLLGLLLGGVVCAQPAWLADLGLDFWRLSEYGQELERQRLRGERLSVDLKLALERLEVKDRITRRLVAGQHTLVEAAQLIRDLPHAPSNFYEELRKSEGGTSDGENLCRHLVRGALEVLCHDPCAATAVSNRLKEELNDYLRRNGTVSLP